MGAAVHRVDSSDYIRQLKVMPDLRVMHDGGEDRRRIRQAGRFYHQTCEGHVAAFPTSIQATNSLRKVAPDGATDAAGLHEQHIALNVGNQMMIEADLPKLVDQHCAIGELRTS